MMSCALNWLMGSLLAAGLALLPAFSHAQQYPSKPLRIIVPFAPGGSTDILARMVGQKLTEAWGQQVIIDNRAGANGVLAADITAHANPDGHTLMFIAIGHALNPSLQQKLPYDTERDFTAVSLTAILPLIVAVHPGVKATGVKDLLALSKARNVTYSSGGIGSSQHLAGELINHMAGTRMTHVPYKGGNPGLLDVVGGHIDMMTTTTLTVLPHAKVGRLRGLAVTTSKRIDAWPDLPTVSESALPGYESIAWYGMVAPAGLPAPILSKLSAATSKATLSPEMKDALLKQGAEPVGNGPREFASFIRSETVKYAKVIKAAGIKAE